MTEQIEIAMFGRGRVPVDVLHRAGDWVVHRELDGPRYRVTFAADGRALGAIFATIQPAIWLADQIQTTPRSEWSRLVREAEAADDGRIVALAPDEARAYDAAVAEDVAADAEVERLEDELADARAFQSKTEAARAAAHAAMVKAAQAKGVA